MTVGDLKAELSRWRDDATVTFRSPFKEQEYRFYRFQRSGDSLPVVELDEYSEAPRVALPRAYGRSKIGAGT